MTSILTTLRRALAHEVSPSVIEAAVIWLEAQAEASARVVEVADRILDALDGGNRREWQFVEEFNATQASDELEEALFAYAAALTPVAIRRRIEETTGYGGAL